MNNGHSLMGPKTFPNYFKWAWAGINLITSVDSHRFKDSKKYDSLLLSSNGIGVMSNLLLLLLSVKQYKLSKVQLLAYEIAQP